MQDSYSQEICSAHWDNIRESIVFKQELLENWEGTLFVKGEQHHLCESALSSTDISSYSAQKQLKFR